MSTALATRPEESDIINAALKSNLVKMDIHKATFICAIGASLGISPALALNQVYLVRDKIIIGASIQASLVKASGRYNYRVREISASVCTIAFYERSLDGRSWEEIGTTSYSIDDAKLAGLTGKDVWRQHPRNMLFARALTNGVRWFAPDVLGGAVYDEYEIEGSASIEEPPTRAARPAPAPEVIEAVVEEAPAPAPARTRTAAERLLASASIIATHVGAPVGAVGRAILARYDMASSTELDTADPAEVARLLDEAAAVSQDPERARRWWARVSAPPMQPREWHVVNGELHALIARLCEAWEGIEHEKAKDEVHRITRYHAALPDTSWALLPPAALERSVMKLRELLRIDDPAELERAWSAWSDSAPVAA